MRIHSTAIIDPCAEIDSSVEIGPYAIIDGPVKIGPGTVIAPHVQVLGRTEIGAGCRIHAGAVIGDLPQDKSYQGGESFTKVGPETLIREYATIHRGTQPGSLTSVGARCMIMAHAHVGHNCTVGDEVVLVNGSLLGGYVDVGFRAMISGNAAVHQFVRVGEMAMIAGLAKIVQDVLPFMTVDGPGNCVGVNIVGLRRAGLTSAERAEVKEVYRRLYRQEGTWTDAVAELAQSVQTTAGRRLVEFLQAPSKRGVGGHSGIPLKIVRPEDLDQAAARAA